MESSFNLLDVDNLLQKFFKEHERGISTLHRVFFKTNNLLSLKALKEELSEELRTGCVTFLNKNSPPDELDSYLFYIANSVCKKLSKPFEKKKAEYICPGCLFLNKDTIITLDTIFKCYECIDELRKTEDPKKAALFKTFSRHNKNGYHCFDCERFIPHPIDNATTVSCPYFDCLFVGNFSHLSKMNHPTSKSNPEKLILDSKSYIKDNIISQEIDAYSKLEIIEDLNNKVSKIKEIIETQNNYVPYNSSDFTVKHKQLVYQSFNNLLNKYPLEMVGYLLQTSDSHFGFQHRVFQEYIRLLENSFPFSISKNRKLFKVDNLLDDNLKLFDGISVFDGIVNEAGIVKNETKEFYIGGRKGSISKPYYIGKLLNIADFKTKDSILHLVKDYGFSKISMQNIKPGTLVIVTHLRVPPHHQMGGMVYVNRIRKKISDRAKVICEV